MSKKYRRNNYFKTPSYFKSNTFSSKSKRSHKKSNSSLNTGNVGILIGIIVLVYLLVQYFDIFMLIVALILTYYLVKFIIKINQKKKAKVAYYSSHYYKETKKPFSFDIYERGTYFEIEAFNKIRDAIGEKYHLISDLSFPQMDALNMDSQVDLMLFHDTGIYVIETKNYSGPLSGKIDEDLWVPYLLVPKKRKNNKLVEHEYVVNSNLYNKWKAENYKSNPIKQNNVHIHTLSKIYEANYINIVIFSDDMINLNANNQKTISNIYTLDEFLEFLKIQNKIYDELELSEIYENIIKYNRGNSSEVKSMHISRLKSKR